MSRTTVDLDDSVLEEVRERARRERKSMGTVISELLAQAIGRDARAESPPPFEWISKNMGALVDLEDKEALSRVLNKWP